VRDSMSAKPVAAERKPSTGLKQPLRSPAPHRSSTSRRRENPARD